jgi:hypothetical protein
MNVSELEQYKHQLIAEHAEEIAAVDRLIYRERGRNTHENLNAALPFAGNLETRVIQRRRRMSAAAMVQEAVDKIAKGTEFTRQDVMRRISDEHPHAQWDARRVAVELWHLSRNGTLKTIEAGRGRIPARYRKL